MARKGMGLGIARARQRRFAGTTPTPTPTPVPTPGALATNYATPPKAHYHFHSQTVATDGNGRLTNCPDLQGLAQILSRSGTTAPKLETDALGRKFLRFNGSEAAVIENALTIASQRAWTVIAVARVHQGKTNNQILMPRYTAFVDATNNTAAPSTSGYIKPVNFTSGGVAYLAANTSPQTTTNATDCYKAIPGTQIQVLGVASRSGANGGTRLYVNADSCAVGQQGVNNSFIGAVLGGRASANNSDGIATSATDTFDLYELAVWEGELSNAVADALVAATVGNYAIAQLDTNLVVEGDSLHDGTATTLAAAPASARGLASRLTEPGAGFVPANVRVIELATSGATVPTLLSRRDASNTIYGLGRFPGGAARNIVLFQIGRNDLVQQDNTAAAHYAAVVALINTASTGYLQRGWKVAVGVNIATIAGIAGTPPDGLTACQQRIDAYRALIADGTGMAIHPAFAADTLTAAGQAFESLVALVPLQRITVAGDTKFATTIDAADTASGYYDSDQTHLRVAGMDLIAAGGDNPACGYAAII